MKPSIPRGEIKRKVWITVQVPIELRNEVSKTCELLGINLSQYLRKHLKRLVNAGKLNRLPKDETDTVEIPKIQV